jgi:glycosyltransferase 2 family protein
MAFTFTLDKKTFLALKAIVAVIVLALLIRRISWSEMYDALRNADLNWISLALLLLPLNFYTQFRRWRLMVLHLHPQVSTAAIMRSLLCGITLGFITPGRFGEMGRAVFIPEANWLALIGLTLVEKWYALLVVYLFGLVGLIPFLQAAFRPVLWVPVLGTGLILVICGIALVLQPSFLSYVLKRFDRSRQRKRLHQVLYGISQLTSRLSLSLFLLTILQVLTYFTQFYLIIKAFSPLPLPAGFSAISSIMWSKTLLPISLGDLGIRETASVYFLGKVGVPEAIALDSALLLFTVNVLLPAVIGFVALLQSRMLQNGNGSLEK